MQPLNVALRELASRDCGAAPQGHVGNLRRRGSPPPARHGGQARPGRAPGVLQQAEFKHAIVRRGGAT